MVRYTYIVIFYCFRVIRDELHAGQILRKDDTHNLPLCG